MAKYGIEKELGTGLTGESFRVNDKKTKRTRVLKMIEAKDSSEAFLIVTQMSELQELKHPYIALPIDVYSTFDVHDAAAYVHVVRTYHPKGTLDTYLRAKRLAGEKVAELQIQKWIGQLVDVLRFLNSKKVLHRNLKPSNLLLGAPDNEESGDSDELLQVCDFGVAAVMADCRTKLGKHSKAYHAAPESVRHAFNEACDFWSFGALLLEIASCGLVTEENIRNILLEAPKWHSTAPLLDLISQSYCPELAALIRGLIRVDVSKRLTLRDLLCNQYVLNCLQLTDSTLVQRRARQAITPENRPIPENKDYKEQVRLLVAYIQQETQNELCVLEAFNRLARMHEEAKHEFQRRPKTPLDHADQQDIMELQGLLVPLINAINYQLISDDVCFSGMKAIAHFLRRIPAKALPELPVLVDLTAKCLQQHPESTSVYTAGGELINIICSNHANASKLANTDVVSLLCTLLQSTVLSKTNLSGHLQTNEQFYRSGFSGLLALSVSHSSILMATQGRKIFSAVVALLKNSSNQDTLDAVLSHLLAIIKTNNSSFDQMLENDVIFTLLKIADKQASEPKLFTKIVQTLDCLARLSRTAALEIFDPAQNQLFGSLDGVRIFVITLDFHRNNSTVMEAVCDFTEGLFGYDGLADCISSKWMLLDILKAFSVRYQQHKVFLLNKSEVICTNVSTFYNKAYFVCYGLPKHYIFLFLFFV